MRCNKVFIAGNLVKDSTMKELTTGNTVFSFTVAENNRDKVSFFDVDYFTKSEAIVKLMSESLVKGAPVFITARLTQDRWESTDGSKKSKVKLVANDVQLLSKAPAASSSNAPEPVAPSENEEVPF